MRRARGFTLVELLIVIVVLGILSGIVLFGVARFRSDATLAACSWQGWDLTVDVAVSCGCLPLADSATVRARAGPVVKVMS